MLQTSSDVQTALTLLEWHVHIEPDVFDVEDPSIPLDGFTSGILTGILRDRYSTQFEPDIDVRILWQRAEMDLAETATGA